MSRKHVAERPASSLRASDKRSNSNDCKGLEADVSTDVHLTILDLQLAIGLEQS